MNNRPLSVTIIGWFLIVTGVASVWSLYGATNDPLARSLMERSALPIGVQIAMSALGLVVAVVCGWAILKGKDWGRVGYIGWSLFGIAVALIASPFKSLILFSVIFVAIVAFFLFRAPANAFFGRHYFGGAGDAAAVD